MSNKNISSWNDLAQFGIGMLTGEACRFSQRLLCDLTGKGRAIMAEYLGVDADGFAKNWNSSVNGEAAVASVMLHRDSLNQVAEFVLFQDGALAIAPAQWGFVGIYEEEQVKRWAEYLEQHPERGGLRRNYAAVAGAHQMGSRNVHQATGRVC